MPGVRRRRPSATASEPDSGAERAAPRPKRAHTDSTKSWYENPDFADFKIELSDGYTFPAHRSVLCQRNDYFDAMCGLRSRFAEAGEKEVKLEEDYPDAVKAVIRKIYGFELESHEKQPWLYWFNIVKAADKYGEPDLAKDAEERLEDCANDLTVTGAVEDEAACEIAVNELCDMLDGLTDMESRDSIQALKDKVAAGNFCHFNTHERFRSYILGSPALVEQQLRNRCRDMVERQHDQNSRQNSRQRWLVGCVHHAKKIIRPESRRVCEMCVVEGRPRGMVVRNIVTVSEALTGLL